MPFLKPQVKAFTVRLPADVQGVLRTRLAGESINSYLSRLVREDVAKSTTTDPLSRLDYLGQEIPRAVSELRKVLAK